MPVNPAFLAARAAEQRNRLITYLALPPLFRLPLRGGKFFPVQLCHYTERHRMELLIVDNAVVRGWPALAGDIYQVLWRLHPLFYRPADDTFPNRTQPVSWLTYFSCWWAHRRLVQAVRRIDLEAATAALDARLALSDQDEPAGGDDTATCAPSLASPPVNMWDDLADYASRQWGIGPDRIFDLPRALVWQLHRNRLLSQPDGELEVIDKSDALLGAN